MYKFKRDVPAVFIQLLIIVVLIGFISGYAFSQNSEDKIVRVGTELNFPPYAFLNKDGKPTGFSIELIKSVSDAMGLSIKISTGTWDNVWEALVAGELDVLPIVAKSPQRLGLVEFSLPHTETFDSFIVKEGASPIKDIASARGIDIVVMRSDAAHHELIARNFQKNLILVDTIPEGLALVASGKHHALLCSKLIGTLLIKKHGIKGLSSGPTIKDYKRSFSFAVKKDDRELLEKLNQGLLIVKTNGEYDRIYDKWLTTNDPWRKVRKYLWPAVISLAGLVLIAVAWLMTLQQIIRKKNRELVRRKQAEEALKKSEKTYRNLFENMLHEVHFWELVRDEDGNIKTWKLVDANPAALKSWGMTLPETVGRCTDEIFPKSNATELFMPIVKKIFEENKAHSWETYFPDTNQFLHMASIPLGDYFISTGIDITERKLYEKNLRESEARHGKMIANIGDVIAIIDQDGINRYKSPNIEKLFGWKPEDVVGESTWDNIHPDDIESTQKFFEKVLSEPEAVGTMECRYRCKDGSYKWIEFTGTNLLQDSDINGLLGNYHDITERKLQQKQLIALEKRNQALLNHSPVCHKIVDLEFNLQYMSVSGFKMLKLDNNADVYGKPYPFYFFPETFKNKMMEKLKQVKETGEIRTLEALTNDINGNEVWLDSSLIPVFADRDKIDYITVVSADTTDRKQNEKEKLRLEKQLLQSQKMESVGQLAGGIAHDFNNILYPILGFTQMSIDELPENHPVRGNLQDVMDGAKRARDLVKRILLFSRQKDKKLEPLLIKPVIEESLKLLRSSIPVNIDIQSRFYDGEDFILCDETEIHEIVMNLCTNAYHSMDEKGDTIKIDLKKKEPSPEVNLPEDEYLCLSISDNGAGINPENLQHIFEPYFTTKEVGKGSGLGLSVVHGIVKSYQGEITVESIPGKGTVFKIFLPVTTPSDIPQPEKEPSDLLMGNEKILFVDDEKAIVKLGTRVLEKAGFTVTGVMESSEALALVKKNPEKYDLIITDMTMPGIVGTDLAKKISVINPDVPVLICSGYSEKLDKSQIEIPNIKDYLDKPILADKLIVKVREILDQNRDKNEKDIDN